MEPTRSLSLQELEKQLRDAFIAIVYTHGHVAATQAIGKLLAEPQLAVNTQPSCFSTLASNTFDLAEVLTPNSNISELPSLPGSGVQRVQALETQALRHAQELPHPSAAGLVLASQIQQRPQSFALQLQRKPSVSEVVAKAPPRWARVVGQVIRMNRASASPASDLWATRCLHKRPMERCVRMRYNPHTGEWVTDDVLVKVEDKPFAAGAMRECFAMKKLSTVASLGTIMDWQRAQNCVAKHYKKGQADKKRSYFTDVLVQMDAKALGDEYNKTQPPKTVDVLQASVLQFNDRKGSPLFAVENLIEGDYVKYNSNSGFVAGDDAMRYTPQAFSHYTFELTRGYKICVDIQGVGDLYTDPQIHTLDGEAYGEGNLGLRGMALFFRTHECNDLCTRLGLEPFGRCEADLKAQGATSSSSKMSSAGTISKTLQRRGSFAMQYKRRVASDAHKATARTMPQLVESLKTVPKDESAAALVHLEVSKLYSETVLLPDIRPEEDPDDALRGGLFHLQFAASQGCVLAMCMLARCHAGLEPVVTSYAYMIKRAADAGEFVAYPEIAFRYAQLAADRGIKAAQAAVAHAYATGGGLGEHALEEPMPAKALQYYKQVLEHPWDESGARQSLTFGLGDDGDDIDELQACVEDNRTVSKLARSISWMSRVSQVSEKEELRKRHQGSQLPIASLEVSKDFLDALRMAAEEEAGALPGGSPQRHEIMAFMGEIYKDGSEGVEPDYQAAAMYFTQAAEEAESMMKAKLSMKYYELAAECEGMIEE